MESRRGCCREIVKGCMVVPIDSRAVSEIRINGKVETRRLVALPNF